MHRSRERGCEEEYLCFYVAKEKRRRARSGCRDENTEEGNGEEKTIFHWTG